MHTFFQILKVDMGCQDNRDIGGLHSSRHVKWPVNATVLPSYLAKLTSGTAHLLTKHYEDPATVSLDQRHCYGETPLASFTRPFSQTVVTVFL